MFSRMSMLPARFMTPRSTNGSGTNSGLVWRPSDGRWPTAPDGRRLNDRVRPLLTGRDGTRRTVREDDRWSGLRPGRFLANRFLVNRFLVGEAAGTRRSRSQYPPLSMRPPSVRDRADSRIRLSNIRRARAPQSDVDHFQMGGATRQSGSNPHRRPADGQRPASPETEDRRRSSA
jgi:hypothetical protein